MNFLRNLLVNSLRLSLNAGFGPRSLSVPDTWPTTVIVSNQLYILHRCFLPASEEPSEIQRWGCWLVWHNCVVFVQTKYAKWQKTQLWSNLCKKTKNKKRLIVLTGFLNMRLRKPKTKTEKWIYWPDAWWRNYTKVLIGLQSVSELFSQFTIPQRKCNHKKRRQWWCVVVFFIPDNL